MGRLEELAERFKNEPLAQLLGANLDFLEDGLAKVSAPVRDSFLIIEKVVQGGITTAIADFAGVYAAMSKIPTGHTPATNINIHFLRPIMQNEVMEAVAKVENDSRSSILVSVNVYASGKLKAYGTISFAKPKAC